MGIYTYKSPTCGCIGCWSSLTNDTRFCLSDPCSKHSITVGNIIWYDLRPLLQYIGCKNYQPKYALRIINVIKLQNKTLIKVEVNGLNVDVFNCNKQIYYSDMNDEPMWQKIGIGIGEGETNIVHFVFVYDCMQHCSENDEEWVICNDY